MKIKMNSLIVLILVVVVTSCSSIRLRSLAPIPGTPVPDGIKATDIKKSIKIAGSHLGWTITESSKSKSTLIGKLYVRQHMIEVAIPYSTSEYSFKYVDSSNMYYNPGEMKIHKKYATWVHNLRKQIHINLIRKANE